MKKISYIMPVILLSALFSCHSSREDHPNDTGDRIEGTISISGAFALYPLVNIWADEFRKEYPDIRLNISAGGAGKGMADVLAGATDLGMLSREITQAEKDKGAWWVAVTKDAVLPTINDKNPALEELKRTGTTQQELAAIFLTAEKQRWKNSGASINVYTRSDASGAAAVWAQFLGAKTQEELRGVAVFGDPGVADAVKKDIYAIGFNNVIYVYDLSSGNKYPGIEVLPVDINENGMIDPEENFYNTIHDITAAIADGRYPSPPARELYLISHGVPEKREIKLFLNWILTKGQDFVQQNGYTQLTQITINEQKEKLRMDVRNSE